MEEQELQHQFLPPLPGQDPKFTWRARPTAKSRSSCTGADMNVESVGNTEPLTIVGC